jgi:hypothetical protein
MYHNLCMLNHYYKMKLHFISISKPAKDLPNTLNLFHEVTHSAPFNQV